MSTTAFSAIVITTTTIFIATTAISVSSTSASDGHRIQSTQSGHGVTICWHCFCSQL
jgi:hypothetical protein